LKVAAYEHLAILTPAASAPGLARVRHDHKSNSLISTPGGEPSQSPDGQGIADARHFLLPDPFGPQSMKGNKHIMRLPSFCLTPGALAGLTGMSLGRYMGLVEDQSLALAGALFCILSMALSAVIAMRDAWLLRVKHRPWYGAAVTS
jgi:hypothetical protein